MGLTMNEKRAVAREVAERYQKASKKQKGAMLTEFIALTGYHRTYASWLLSNFGRKVHLRVRGKPAFVTVHLIQLNLTRSLPSYRENSHHRQPQKWERTT